MAESKEPRKRAKSSASTAASATATAAPGAAAVEPRDDGRVRAVVDALSPMVDGGRFAAKRIAGERVVGIADYIKTPWVLAAAGSVAHAAS